MTPVLAIDIGGTNIEAALVSATGLVLPDSRIRVATGSTPQAFAASLQDALAHVRAHPSFADARGCGIGSAGPIDLNRGEISPVNLPLVQDFPVVKLVREVTGIPDIQLRLDGTCIALAELWRGAAVGAENALVFVVSTGIGGGVIADGKIVSGASGNAGHFGQMLIASPANEGSSAVEAGWPGSATLEEHASGKHTIAWAKAQGWAGETGEELAAAHAAGNAIAIKAVERSVQALGRGLAGVTNLLDTQLAVIGGGFSFVTEDFPARIERAAHAASVNAFGTQLRVVRAALGDEAPLIGAAGLVLQPQLLRQ